jgi:hypothetical protein
MKKLLFVSLALATALATSPAAKADSFTFTLSGVGLTGSGTVSGSSAGGGVFNLTSGSVVVNGTSGTLIPITAYSSGTVNITVAGGVATYYYNWPNVGEAFTFDNKLIFPGTPHTDSNGLAFSLPDGALLDFWYDSSHGGYYYNIFSGTVSGENFGWLFDPQSATGGAPADMLFESSVTPEPSSLILLGTGLLLMAGFLFRKAKPSMIQSA